MGLETPKEIWDELEMQFMPKKTMPDEQYLKERLSSLKMKEGLSLAEHIDVFR